MAPGPQLKLNDPIVVDGTKYRIKGVGIASLHLYDRFAVIGRRDLYIDIARITGWDRVAGVWRVAPCEAADIGCSYVAALLHGAARRKGAA
jgi:hypothetical protein